VQIKDLYLLLQLTEYIAACVAVTLITAQNLPELGGSGSPGAHNEVASKLVHACPSAQIQVPFEYSS